MADPGTILETEDGSVAAAPDHTAPRTAEVEPGNSLAGQLCFYAQDR
jgi:hypothetical protein